MKKLFLSLLIGLTSAVSSYAVPACPIPEKVIQPDGSVVTIRLVGDEFFNYSTTTDGYTVVRNDAGYYMYAVEQNGSLVASSYVAKDASMRSAADKAFLGSVAKNLKPAFTKQSDEMRAAVKSMSARPLLHGNGKYDTSNFRGLIILVEYSDLAFSRTDINAIFNDMVNKRNYDGFMSASLIPEKMEYTGSVRDYYYDNSMGQFDPQFDIVGPVKIGYSQYDAESSTNGKALVAAAAKASDGIVNFADYDRDGDGTVDMVYFIFAGYGANFSGNDSRLLWPHASTMFGVRLDNVTLSRYACSCEMYGRQGSNTIDGIGTVCHEFSHVLGLPDEYDTDYASSGGQSIHPATWSIMAGGSYRNKSRTPVGYTLYERYALGFAQPKLIDGAGDFELKALNSSNEGYRINSAVKDEFFLIENRQKEGWDAYLNGHGMIVTRVDSTSVDVWEDNKINCNPAHNYLEILRANPKTSTSGTTTTVTDSEGDPFPGSGNVTEITNETTPSLRSWTKSPTALSIKNIAEGEDGVITFSTMQDEVRAETEDFESMPVTDGKATTLDGKFCKWSLSGGARISEAQDGYGNGSRVLALYKKAEVATSALSGKTDAISFNAYNSSSSMTILRCYYSLDGGNTWVSMNNVDGVNNITVAGKTNMKVMFNAQLDSPCIKIMQYTGSTSIPCYIDDVTITYDKSGAVESVVADSDNADFKACCIDGNLNVVTADSVNDIAVYNASGVLVATMRPADGIASTTLPAHGFYIVSQGGKSAKVIY